MLSQSLSTAISKLIREDGAPVEWAVSAGYVDYPVAVEAMHHGGSEGNNLQYNS